MPDDAAPLMPDRTKRLLVTLGALVAVRMGYAVPLPGLDLDAVRRMGAESLLGSDDRLSLFALGLMPYLSAFVLVHLVVALVPSLRARRRQDRAPIERVVRLVAVPLALVQAIGVAYGLEGVSGLVPAPGPGFVIGAAATLAGGSLLLVWLADRITAQALGNGVVAILAVGILASLPATLLGMVELLRSGAASASEPAAYGFVLLSGIALVVVMEGARRTVTLADGRAIALGLEPAGILPPLFAFTLLPYALTPVALLMADPAGGWLAQGRPVRIAVTALAIAAAAVPCALAAVDLRFGDSEETAGGLRAIQMRLAVLGGLALAALYLLPEAVLRLIGVVVPSGFMILIVTLAALALLRALRPSPPSPGGASRSR